MKDQDPSRVGLKRGEVVVSNAPLGMFEDGGDLQHSASQMAHAINAAGKASRYKKARVLGGTFDRSGHELPGMDRVVATPRRQVPLFWRKRTA